MQHGSDTVIGPQARVLLMDCFETLVHLGDGGYRARTGIERFLDHFSRRRAIPVVVVSDAPEADVTGALRQAGLLAWIAGIFDRRQLDTRGRKSLDRILAELGMTAAEAVFIGDSPLDAEAARTHGVPFIRVPRSEDRGFSFERLISGPSRYRSGEFMVHLDNEFRRP